MQAFFAWFVRILVGVFLDRIFVFLRSFVEVWLARQEIKKRAEESLKKLKEAKTGKEVSDSVKSSLDDI